MTRKSIEITVVITASILQTVEVQMVFPGQQPMFMMPAPPPMAVQVMPPPPPVQVGVPVPFPVPVPVIVTKKTTTTTTEAPSREEKEENNNVMVFGGNPFAPPVIVMPIPSSVRRVEYEETSETESRSDDSSESSDSSRTARKTRKKHRMFHIRCKGPRKKHHLHTSVHGQNHHENHQKQERNKRHSGFSDPDIVKPVLTYQSKHGNVKFKTKISGDDAARLMGIKKMHTTEEESSDVSRMQSPMKLSGLRLVENTEKTRGIGTLPDKKVSNISVSYQVF